MERILLVLVEATDEPDGGRRARVGCEFCGYVATRARAPCHPSRATCCSQHRPDSGHLAGMLGTGSLPSSHHAQLLRFPEQSRPMHMANFLAVNERPSLLQRVFPALPMYRIHAAHVTTNASVRCGASPRATADVNEQV
jgi:hypothetical protein